MLHDKTGLLHLAAIFKERGIEYLIVSPGSRNAPVVSVFCGSPDFKCLTIVDERSAAFFALGMAQQLEKPVAIVCTSGTAALNYAPAIAEAFYLQLPLIVLTADRPVEWIDQGDGQTIRQRAVFEPHVRKSVQLPQSISNADDLWYNDRLISEALNAAEFPVKGPVHINLPFAEPLYGFDQTLRTVPKNIQLMVPEAKLSAMQANTFAKAYNASGKRLLLVGQMKPSQLLEQLIQKLVEDTSLVVLTETTSNLSHPAFFSCIDRSLSAMKNPEDYQPDFLITMGGPIVSKRIKSFLRKSPVTTHWNIGTDDQVSDLFQHLTHQVLMSPETFIEQINPQLTSNSSIYRNKWIALESVALEKHAQYLNKSVYSDLKVLDFVFKELPQSIPVHLANSTPVRYAQLFNHPSGRHFYSNRGTSGIDGCISTAAGFTYLSNEINLVITGDLSFFYDSNALWNRHLSNKLKVLVINNGGGGIFRFIEGPSETGLLEPFFEAAHQTSAKGIAQAYGLRYFEANTMLSLEENWPLFLQETQKPALLEVFTPSKMNASVLHCYFKSIALESI